MKYHKSNCIQLLETSVLKMFLYIVFMFLALSSSAKECQEYRVENDWITGHNLERYNNRPLYLQHSDAFILTGDKPICRFAQKENLFGTIYFSYVCGNIEKPFQDFSDIKSCYRGGRMKWFLKDKSFPHICMILELVADRNNYGGEFKISFVGKNTGYIKWIYGDKELRRGEVLSWSLDVMGHPELLTWGIQKDFKIEQEDKMAKAECHYLYVKMNENKGLTISASSKEQYENALKALTAFNSRLNISTPDKYLNAMMKASLAAVDGCWYPPVFVHGCMQWNKALPGWRTMFGGIIYGWHDRILQEAKHYIETQIKTSDKVNAEADSAKLLTVQSQNSRFYGVGRIQGDQDFYDMQTQFFDQLIEEYRWSNSAELIQILRPALELHLKWMDECFDPDSDGLYESYINTWPTDAQWYNGGGTAEETSYAYRAHSAALEMASALHDTVSASHHQKILERIQKGFLARLWIKNLGYSGAYREQGGYERIHENPWLYSIFLPIDAQLINPLQKIESLFYPEYALQNDTICQGGRMIWTSNWVPGIWSVRELWPGDNYHLALSYFQSGLSDEGYEILKGMFMNTGFCGTVPGNLGFHQGGIDFGDCIHPFVRSVVSGLFGYQPDYPSGQVILAPSFPTSWKEANIHVPDFSLSFQEAKDVLSYHVVLLNNAVLKIQIPVSCCAVKSVSINGKPVNYKVLPAAGRSIVVAQSEKANDFSIRIEYDRPLPYYKPLHFTFSQNSTQNIQLAGVKVMNVYDTQNVFENIKTNGNQITSQIKGMIGFHTAIAKVKVGDCEQWRVLRIHVVNADKQRKQDYQNMVGENFREYHWLPLDIHQNFNADICEIFRQKYLTPRPKTVSVRIGSNGYSPWAFTFWGSKVPDIELNGVDKYLRNGILQTTQGIDFLWNANQNKNVAFTSLWDNYPREISFDLMPRKGKSISFLVCGSTNVMQCDIANAVILMEYENGERDSIELIPPYNYWNLCPIDSHASGPGQSSRTYYTSEIDKFCLRNASPMTIELGNNCRAMILCRRLNPQLGVKRVILKCLSQEVVVGIMGISIATP